MSRDKQINAAIVRMQELYKAVAVPELLLRDAKLGKTFKSTDYKIFMKDCKKCLEGWQYFEPAGFPIESRFELDREAYIETFFNDDLADRRSIQYDEQQLLKRLIKNLKPAQHPYFVTYRELLKVRLKGLNGKSVEAEAVNASILREQLAKYGVFKLEMVSCLSDYGQEQLLQHIATSELPYKIAMLHYIGFTELLYKEYAVTKNEMYNILHAILGVSVRSIKGNINILNPKSRESRERYTAHLYKEDVKKDYKSYK